MVFIFKFLFLFIFSLSFISCSQQRACGIKTTLAYDIGSGTTKILVADFDSCKNKVVKVHLEDSLPVGYAQDLSGEKDYFSAEIKKEGRAALQYLTNKAQVYSPEYRIGVASEAFRKAKNARDFFQELRREFSFEGRIISQEQEGILAYNLVAHHFSRLLNGQGDLLVWDMGGGSQQLVWHGSHQFHFFNSQIASVTFKNRLIRFLERADGTESPNPISKEEGQRALKMATALIEDQVPFELIRFVESSPLIVALGGVHGASLKRQMNLNPGDQIKRDHLARTLEASFGKTDQQIGGRYAATDVGNLILVSALMDVYGIDAYYFMSADLTEAIILFPEVFM